MFDKALLRLRGMKAALALLLASAVAQSALILGQTFALAGVLAALWNGASPSSQAGLLLCFLGCFAVRRIIVAVQDTLLDRYAGKRAAELRAGVLARTFGETARLASTFGTASTALAATGGIDDVERYVRVIPPKLCGVAGIALPVLAALFAIDWVSGVIVLMALPVIALFMVVLGKQARERATRQFQESGKLANCFIDSVRGIGSIMALDAGEQAATSVYEASERMRVSTVRTLSVATLSSAVLDLITVFGIAGVAMLLAFRLMDASLSLQTALSALMLAPEFFAPIRAFASDFHASLDGKNALAETLRIIDATIAAGEDSAGDAGWSPSRTFEARGLAYSPDGAVWPLRHATFGFEGSQLVGIVGTSGAGKSTLVDLLAGLKEPSDGTVLIDGKPVELASPLWRRSVHYIPQNPHVFSASLKDNVTLYAPNATREIVEQAIDAVGLRQLVDELPEGLETALGEGGRALSGGEAQRIALARAFLDTRPVLFFDEPTAHLDIETEYELKQRMKPLMEGKLVFFATHRLHWLADMDTVVVLDAGTVVEQGAPSELLSRGGALAALVRAENGEVAHG